MTKSELIKHMMSELDRVVTEDTEIWGDDPDVVDETLIEYDKGWHNGFDYAITGAMETWAGERGIGVVVVELASSSSSESYRNLSAMWNVIKN